MKEKLLKLFILASLSTGLDAQIAITEVYYDTPFYETADSTELHHAGEYIELFNYTTEDLDISGWILSDSDGSFTFPENTIIPSDDFILFTWDPREGDADYFVHFFPSTQGQESKMIRHQSWLLNNQNEEISLYMTSILGIELPRHQLIHKVRWEFPKTIVIMNYINYHKTYDYSYNYYVKSFQLINDDEFQANDIFVKSTSTYQTTRYRNATPMELDFPYELVPLESVQAVIDAILNNYNLFIGNSGVLDLLNNICDKYVALISENVINHTVVSERCPEYDESGNFIGLLENCPTGRPGNEDETPEFIAQEDYSSKVWVAPNPTRTKTTIFWEKEIEDLIAEIIVVPVNGGQHIPISYLKNETRADVNLSTYPSGIYVVRFTFASGQVVTKSIIKI